MPEAAAGAEIGPSGGFVERLTPAPWVWVTSLLVAASSGLVVLAVAGPRGAGVVAVAAMAATTWALLRSSAVVQVTDGELRAGRARIPVVLLGSVHELDAARMDALRGPKADARAYLCQRGWIAAGVAVSVDDPADPAPYWLLSSRQPAALAAALRTAIAAGTSPASGRTAGPGSGPASATGQAHSRQTS